ncbi:MAG: type IIL restriction-modification enzyme MmeI [Nitratireductor sp.]
MLDLPRPDTASKDTENNTYAFERAVTFAEAGDRTGHGRIDLYKKGCFVLEAKQSVKRSSQKKPDSQEDLDHSERVGCWCNRSHAEALFTCWLVCEVRPAMPGHARP